jgi:hypothetical protein
MAEQTQQKQENKDEKTPMHKQWWFWLILVIILAGLGYGGMKYMNKPAPAAFAYYF